MKVLIAETFLPGSIYTLELGRELRKYADLTVFCNKNAGETSIDGVRFIKKLYGGGSGRLAAMAEYAAGLLALQSEITRSGYDIIHVQSFKSDRREIPIYIRAKKHCKALVHTVHNILPHEADSTHRRLYSEFYDACDALIVHNEYCKNILISDFGLSADKIAVVPHGTYALVEKPTPSAAPRGGKTNFLQFGIMRQYKGIDILLRAIALIPREKRAAMSFVIAGRQYPKLDATDYRAMARELDIEDCVTLINSYIPQEKLAELFGQADICLFPYRNIYGSGALMMAYSYSKPVIASDIPAFYEETAAGSAGLLFKSEDPEALRGALLSAAAWPQAEYEKHRAAVENLAANKYNWAVSAKALAEVYSAAGGQRAAKEEARRT